jgi:hypothetical protein
VAVAVAQFLVPTRYIAAGKDESHETSVKSDRFRVCTRIATCLGVELRGNVPFSTCNPMLGFLQQKLMQQ